jgi:hypothetical protein
MPLDPARPPPPVSAGSGAAVPRSPVDVALAAGEDTGPTLARALALLGGLGWAAGVDDPIMILVGSRRAADPPGPTAGPLRDELRRATPATVRFVCPPSSVAAVRFPVAGDPRWVSVPAAVGAERFERVVLPRSTATAGALCLVVPTVAGRDAGPLALETLARHAHPRQALAARLDRRRLGVAAELASPLRPRLIVVPSRIRGHPVVAATGDRIAAELIALAFRHDLTADESPGPWEDPLVQRATQLDLGVRTPRALRLISSWAGNPASPVAASFVALVDRLGLRLGVPSSADDRG